MVLENETAADILADPSASQWLRAQVLTRGLRDPVDLARDIERLQGLVQSDLRAANPGFRAPLLSEITDPSTEEPDYIFFQRAGEALFRLAAWVSQEKKSKRFLTVSGRKHGGYVIELGEGFEQIEVTILDPSDIEDVAAGLEKAVEAINGEVL